MDYTSEDLRDYFFIKHARKINHKGMKRWILRSEVYTVTNPLIKKGVQHVNTEIFNQYEQFVMDELTKQLRYGGALYDSKTII